MYLSHERMFEYQVRVTLFDEPGAQFYGNTIISAAVPFEWINHEDL